MPVAELKLHSLLEALYYIIFYLRFPFTDLLLIFQIVQLLSRIIVCPKGPPTLFEKCSCSHVVSTYVSKDIVSVHPPQEGGKGGEIDSGSLEGISLIFTVCAKMTV